jgi:hypothetical protein
MRGIAREVRALGLQSKVPRDLRDWVDPQRQPRQPRTPGRSYGLAWEPPRPSKARAKRIAENHAARWEAASTVALDDGRTEREAFRYATTTTQYGLDTIATTESSVAFTEARDDYAAELAAAGLPIVLQWRAELDACPVCWDLDGDEVPADEGWDVEPGAVHPNCRCYDVVVMAGE